MRSVSSFAHARMKHAGYARAALVVMISVAFIACEADGSARQHANGAPEAASDGDVTAAPPALFDPREPFARPSLCDRPKDDAVRDVFCKEPRTPVRSLRELEGRLSLKALTDSVDDAQAEAAAVGPDVLVDFVVYLGHSTALSGQLVSPINPRAILIGPSTFLAYQRGVQQVEIITTDRSTSEFNFYLVSFAQACNRKPAGCSPGDLYTQKVEREWTEVALRDDEELKNTPLDCRQCHLRGRDRPGPLMRELRGPWTHFFAPYNGQDDYDLEGEITGAELARDFLRAKGGEAYAGLPAFLTRNTAGVFLENRVSTEQPLTFESEAINAELYASRASGKPRRSARWDAAYDAFKRGEQLALPHFEPRPTDPGKLAALSDAYVRYRAGELDADLLPDLSDVFPDDPQVRAEIGLQTEPGASGAELLVQACGSCHNDVLDPSISRARFNIALSGMPRAELELAIARIELAPSDALAMPPHGTRQLDGEGRARLIAYLAQSGRPAEDDAFLERAAALGMSVDAYHSPGM